MDSYFNIKLFLFSNYLDYKHNSNYNQIFKLTYILAMGIEDNVRLNEEALEEFSNKYITASDICAMFKVQRCTVLNARNRGLLPGAFKPKGVPVFIWEKKKLIPFLDSWRISLASRRGELRVKE